MRGTKTALSGVRPFHQITARRGNGIFLTSQNGQGNDELRNVSDLPLQRFNASTNYVATARVLLRDISKILFPNNLVNVPVIK
jgi:hypothetical protein